MIKADVELDIAHEMAARQRSISVSEFFLKNRHLLGFDSQTKATLTTVKEAVDNALDACEEAAILPEILVEISNLKNDQLLIAVQDNGPGIVEEQIGRIFGKLLYGSKFHKLSQSRGQQGMGIAATGMYAQLTTGQPLHVWSRIQNEPTATELRVTVNTAKNLPEIHRKRKISWDCPHGTRVEARIEGRFQRGPHSVAEYLEQTAIANPHVTLHFRDPEGRQVHLERRTRTPPPLPVNIKPHPRGVELGQLIQMLSGTKCRTLLQFLEREFSRIGRKTARKIIRQANSTLTERSYPRRIAHEQSTALFHAIQSVSVSAPRTDCLVPIGEQQILEGLRSEIEANFYTATTRPAAVYRGNPFQIEIGLAYGCFGHSHSHHWEVDQRGRLQKGLPQRLKSETKVELRSDEPAQLLRFANRVPLLYDKEGCATAKAAVQMNWRAYGLEQPKGSLPIAPLVILIHMASVWVPFTSEAKEAIASYPEILKEIKLGLQECGRRLAVSLRREARFQDEFDKRSRIEKYLTHIGSALQAILDFSDEEKQRTIERLDAVFQNNRRL